MDRRARSVVGVGITALSGSCEHVRDARNRVGRPGLVCFGIGEPLQGGCVTAHGRIPDRFGIAGHASEAVAALAQNDSISVPVGVNDSC